MRIQLIPLTVAVAGALSAQNCFEPGRYRSNDAIAERNFQTGENYFVQKQYSAALHYLSIAAQRNHPRADELMGQIYMFGYGVQVNAREALRYFSAAAEQGHRGALADLGFYYSDVEVNLAKADGYLLAAARCGSFDAEVELGFNYEFGRGVPRNRQQAIFWLRQAAPHWGQAAFAAEWLSYPDTPHFQNADQLGQYIAAKTRRKIALTTPRVRMGTGPCGIGAHQVSGMDSRCAFDDGGLVPR